MSHLSDFCVLDAADAPVPTTTATDNVETKTQTSRSRQQQTIQTIDPDRTYILHCQGISDSSGLGTGIGVTLRWQNNGTARTTKDNIDHDDDDNNMYDDKNKSAAVVVWKACHYLPGGRSPRDARGTALVLALRLAIRQLGLRHVRVGHLAGGTDIRDDVEAVHPWPSAPNNHNEESLHPRLFHQFASLRDELHEIGSFHWEAVQPKDDEECQALAQQAIQTRELGTWSVTTDQNHLSDKASWIDPMGRDYVDKTFKGTTIATNDTNAVDEIKPIPSKQVLRDPDTDDDANTASAEKANEVLNIDPSQLYRLKFDGGSRGNPGTSGVGVVLYDPSGQEIWSGCKQLCGGTNNQAEYNAILFGLESAQSQGIRRIQCQGDSQLIIRQLLGEYKVRSETLRDLYAETKKVMANFEEVQLMHINREDNKRADALANAAMDKAEESDL